MFNMSRTACTGFFSILIGEGSKTGVSIFYRGGGRKFKKSGVFGA